MRKICLQTIVSVLLGLALAGGAPAPAQAHTVQKSDGSMGASMHQHGRRGPITLPGRHTNPKHDGGPT